MRTPTRWAGLTDVRGRVRRAPLRAALGGAGGGHAVRGRARRPEEGCRAHARPGLCVHVASTAAASAVSVSAGPRGRQPQVQFRRTLRGGGVSRPHRPQVGWGRSRLSASSPARGVAAFFISALPLAALPRAVVNRLPGRLEPSKAFSHAVGHWRILFSEMSLLNLK